MSNWFATISSYAYLGIIAGSAFVILKICHYLLLARLHSLAGRSKNGLDDMLFRALKKINWGFLLALALWLATKYTILPALVNKILDAVIIVLAAGTIIAVLNALVREIFNRRLGQNERSQSLSKISALALGVLFWLLALIFILSNFGVNVVSLLAGLGLSGIIIAFALQNVLADLFNSLAIYLDQPFKENDYIVVGTNQGWVKKIGFKSTRLLSRDGQEVVVANQELTKAVINNFADLAKRRVCFNLSLTYNTGSVKCREALKIIRQAITSTEHALFERAHFTAFGDSALLYEVVYHVKGGADLKYFLDVQQTVNFKIKRGFEQADIIMAYPTQTVYLEKS